MKARKLLYIQPQGFVGLWYVHFYALASQRTPSFANSNMSSTDLVEWVGSGTPVCKEHAETDSLEDTGQDTDGDSIKRPLLSNNLGNDLRSWLGNWIAKQLKHLHLERQMQRRSKSRGKQHPCS